MKSEAVRTSSALCLSVLPARRTARLRQAPAASGTAATPGSPARRTAHASSL